MDNSSFSEKCDKAFDYINGEINNGFANRSNYFHKVENASHASMLSEAINDACNCFATNYEEYCDMWDLFECLYRHDLNRSEVSA